MTNQEGWITRVAGEDNHHINVAHEEGKEPSVKHFRQKRIYLPSEQQKYEQEALRRGDNVLWLGVTGWTKPPKHYAERYGTSSEGKIYESLVTALLMESILELKRHGIAVDLRHGVSDAGVDAAAMRVMELLPVTGSGVNCPMYMTWVTDDVRGGPVYVAESKDAYHEAYSKYHQLLIVTGGRDAAFYHDYLRRLKGAGYSLVADVIQTISPQEIPGRDVMPNPAEPQLNNAAAYIREKNSFIYSPIPRTFDELSAMTRLTSLHNACNILKREQDRGALAVIEDEVIRHRKNPVYQITKAELEARITQTRDAYLQLV